VAIKFDSPNNWRCSGGFNEWLKRLSSGEQLYENEHLKAIAINGSSSCPTLGHWDSKQGPWGVGGGRVHRGGARVSKVNLSGVPFQQLVSQRTPPLTPSRPRAGGSEAKEAAKRDQKSFQMWGLFPFFETPVPSHFLFIWREEISKSTSMESRGGWRAESLLAPLRGPLRRRATGSTADPSRLKSVASIIHGSMMVLTS